MNSLLEHLRNFFKMPDLEEYRTILCIQPHPDDADIGMGATVAKLSEKGAKVFYLTVTDGSAGSTNERLIGETLSKIRKEEQEKAAEILGVHDLVWLDFEDLGDYQLKELRSMIAEHIVVLKPDIVFTVDPFLPYEIHPDHIKCGFAAAQASSFYKLPKISKFRTDHILHAIGFFNTANPNNFYQIERKHLEKKFLALSHHKSQFDEKTLQTLYFYLEERAKVGEDKLAESFKILPPVMLHVFPEAQDF